MTEIENKRTLQHSTASVDELIPYVRNARIHTDEHVVQLAASIKEFGFNNPVLIDQDNLIIAGHGRVMAAKKLGIEEVPVVVLSHFTDAQKRAFILADNKLHDNSSFDYELLQIEIDDLKDSNFDLSIAGFDDLELNLDDSPGFDGLPEPGDAEMGGAEYIWGVIVTLDGEEGQVALLEKLTKEGYKCKALL